MARVRLSEVVQLLPMKSCAPARMSLWPSELSTPFQPVMTTTGQGGKSEPSHSWVSTSRAFMSGRLKSSKMQSNGRSSGGAQTCACPAGPASPLQSADMSHGCCCCCETRRSAAPPSAASVISYWRVEPHSSICRKCARSSGLSSTSKIRQIWFMVFSAFSRWAVKYWSSSN